MALTSVDWVVTWRLQHWQFFWIFLAVGIPIRFLVARASGISYK